MGTSRWVGFPCTLLTILRSCRCDRLGLTIGSSSVHTHKIQCRMQDARIAGAQCAAAERRGLLQHKHAHARSYRCTALKSTSSLTKMS